MSHSSTPLPSNNNILTKEDLFAYFEKVKNDHYKKECSQRRSRCPLRHGLPGKAIRGCVRLLEVQQSVKRDGKRFNVHLWQYRLYVVLHIADRQDMLGWSVARWRGEYPTKLENIGL